MTHLSLCSGIGGLDLAAELAGFTTIGQSEIDPYASRVLAKNFKGVINYGDIRTINYRACPELRTPTVISAGFPCQPYSLAGKGAGYGDERELWNEVARVIQELRPRWFVGENVPGLLARANSKYFRRILADLTQMGYCVSWGIWGACDAGAPHKRDRVFIVAHTNGKRRRRVDSHKKDRRANVAVQEPNNAFPQRACQVYQNTLRFYVERLFTNPSRGVRRNDDGFSAGVDRLRCLGNAVVPAQAFPIFEAIVEIELKGESK